MISKALPEPVEEPSPTVTDGPVPKVEAAVEPAPKINSVPKEEVKAESLPGNSRPLSPYPFVILTFTLHSSLYMLWLESFNHILWAKGKKNGREYKEKILLDYSLYYLLPFSCRFSPLPIFFQHALPFFEGENELLPSFYTVKTSRISLIILRFPMLFLSCIFSCEYIIAYIYGCSI